MGISAIGKSEPDFDTLCSFVDVLDCISLFFLVSGEPVLKLIKGCRPCRRPRKQVWWISYIWLLVEAGKSWYQPKKYINCTLRVVDSGVQFLKKLGPLV